MAHEKLLLRLRRDVPTLSGVVRAGTIVTAGDPYLTQSGCERVNLYKGGVLVVYGARKEVVEVASESP